MNDWISVKEKLPDKSGYCLVFCECESNIEKHIFLCYFDEIVSKFGKWNKIFDPFTLEVIDEEWKALSIVSHWIAIPEPPEQDDMCFCTIDDKIQAIDRYGHM